MKNWKTVVITLFLFSFNAHATFSVIGTAHEFLEQNLQNFLRFEPQFTNYEFQILNPNQDLNCENLPQINMLENSKFTNGRITLYASCTAPNWQTNLIAKIILYHQVLTAKKTFKRGQLLNAHDFLPIQIKFNPINQSAISKFDFSSTQIAAKNISTHTILRPNMIGEDFPIKKGQQVKVFAYAHNVQISIDALALTNGKQEQQISLRSLNSQKIVRAYVIAPGIAQVL